MSPTIKDFLGFVVNPPPGDPTRTAGSDLLPNGAVIAAGGSAGQVPVSDGLGGYTWQTTPWLGTVTSLPGSPVDGQECFYLADATNGVVWNLRYRAASTYWEFVGGAPLFAAASSNQTISATGVLVTTPTLTLPLAGDYMMESGMVFGVAGGSITANTSVNWYGGVAIGGAQVGTETAFFAFLSGAIATNVWTYEGSGKVKAAAVTAGSTAQQIASIVGWNATLTRQFLAAQPIRVH